MLEPELESLLSDGSENYRDAKAKNTPVPVDGVYYLAPLRTRVYRTKTKGTVTHAVICRVVCDQVYRDYEFLATIYHNYALVSWIEAACAAKGVKSSGIPAQDYEQHFRPLLGHAILEVKISRGEPRKDGSRFINFDALRVLPDNDVVVQSDEQAAQQPVGQDGEQVGVQPSTDPEVPASPATANEVPF